MSQAFSPGADRMREAGIAFHVAEYPDGAAGIDMSINVMAQKMREGRNDADLKGWAQTELHKAGLDGRGGGGTVRQRTQVLLDAYRAQTIYSPDPHGTEWIQSPAATLCLRPGLCMRGGDCDDGAVALGSATLSIGIPTVIVKQSFGAGQQQHVLIAVQDERGDWLTADPSTDLPVGSSVRAQSEVRYDPMDVQSASTGTSGAEIVSLGRIGSLRHQMGLGAVEVTPPAFLQAQNDLVNQVDLPIQAADTYLTEGNFAAAVTAYQAAGQAGATSVGPEIDLAGAAWVTQRFTHQAWVSNGDLQGIAATGATQDQAMAAQTYARNMQALWQQAIYEGVDAVMSGKKPPTSSGIATALFWAAGLGVVVGVGYGISQRRKPKRRR